ncbi:MAG: 23S rRNA (adenine(2503)-C(2))-methyltransferase RlmN [Clostridiales bacterium]|nr:23S rRNA (adenine(2503)-C(2))-methyltransferase RlmN [Clostridiales bacterium]
MAEKRMLLNDTPEALREYLQTLSQPAYRARQIFGWLHRGVSFSEMTNLPKTLREQLIKTAVDFPLTIEESYQSKRDDTVKFLFRCMDGNIVEGVMMCYRYGYTMCISTQIGCRMGCKFCASTLGGCMRDLTEGEMLCQVILANRHVADRGKIGHVVLMGSGEPLENYDEAVRFLRLVNHPDGLNISMRSLSLSTCGLVPQIDRLADEGMGITLSISLHAPSDEIRAQIMPVAKRYPIGELMDAVRRYVKKTGRRVLIEYALIDRLNSKPEHAAALAGLLGGLQCHVNLIALNPVKESEFKPASQATVLAFVKTLEQRNISVTLRREMGRDISGACGQLRNHYLKENNKTAIIENTIKP